MQSTGKDCSYWVKASRLIPFLESWLFWGICKLRCLSNCNYRANIKNPASFVYCHQIPNLRDKIRTLIMGRYYTSMGMWNWKVSVPGINWKHKFALMLLFFLWVFFCGVIMYLQLLWTFPRRVLLLGIRSGYLVAGLLWCCHGIQCWVSPLFCLRQCISDYVVLAFLFNMCNSN